ncbi:MAG TPA: TRAP transporter large permease [Syntrophorhabdaceae bacterium]|nr:TRAP transporter large permease [Syntrophorhabdaceae bacterium]HQM80250.1 TRAP transporter large permease [Syntrophorhabdaceae bacterium]
MSEVTVGIIGLVVLLCLFVTGMEMAFLMTIVGFVGFGILNGFETAIGLLANDFMDSLASYGLTAIPLFVLMGQIAFNAGIAGRLYDSAHKFLGHIPGGLAVATVAGATVFKSICGSVAATAATFASVAIPEMDKYGYSKKLSTGIVATVGTLGVLLPPSVILIVFGIATQQSIGKLFMAGILPGLIMAFFFMIVIFGWAKINPKIGPKSAKYSWDARIKTVPSVIWPIVIFFLIIGGLMKGIFTPTEAGAVGAFAVMLLCIIKREIRFRGLKKSLEESLRTTCMVLMLIASSTVLGHFVALTNISQVTAEWVNGLNVHRAFVMIIIFFIYLIGGSFMDDLAFLILATPIFYPIITGLGYDPLWAGIVLCFTVCVGSVIPPVAMCVFIVKNITKVPMGTIYGGVYPFLISMVVVLILLFIFPELATYLPNVFMK